MYKNLKIQPKKNNAPQPKRPKFFGFTIQERYLFENEPDNYFPFDESILSKYFPQRSKQERENFTLKQQNISHIPAILAGGSIFSYSLIVKKKIFFI